MSDPKCPTCGARLDSWTETSKDSPPPQHGDLTVCAYCRTIGTFGSGQSRHVNRMSQEDVSALDPGQKDTLVTLCSVLRDQFGGTDQGQRL